MPATASPDAAAYVRALDLPFVAPPMSAFGVGPDLAPALGESKAVLVGSEVIAFVEGVTPERRELAVRSSLLAQLVAKKRVPDAKKVMDWYEAYLDVLRNIGWGIQSSSFREYRQFEDGLEAHEAIIQAATALLGAGSTALAAVVGTVQALRSVSEGKPWFTLFHREVQGAKTAHFQISLVQPGAGGGFLVSLMAFVIEAERELTQVAFFKFHSSQARLDLMSADITVGMEPGSEVATAIAKKVAGYQKDYVAALDLD